MNDAKFRKNLTPLHPILMIYQILRSWTLHAVLLLSLTSHLFRINPRTASPSKFLASSCAVYVCLTTLWLVTRHLLRHSIPCTPFRLAPRHLPNKLTWIIGGGAAGAKRLITVNDQRLLLCETRAPRTWNANGLTLHVEWGWWAGACTGSVISCLSQSERTDLC